MAPRAPLEKRPPHPPFPDRSLFLCLFLLLLVLFFAVRAVLFCKVNVQHLDTHGLFQAASAEERARIRRDAKRALSYFVVVLYFFVASAFFGLVAVTAWGGDSNDSTMAVFAQTLWLFSPVAAALSGRYLPHVVDRLCRQPCLSTVDAEAEQEEAAQVDRGYFMQFSFDWRRQWRPALAAYLLPSFAGLVAYILTVIARFAAPVNKKFMTETVCPRLGLTEFPPFLQVVFYVLYAVSLGPIWDITAPEETDFGASTGGDWTGTSWLMLAFVEEFGWSGFLFPATRRWFVGRHAFFKSWAVTSTVWVSWHLPFIVVGSSCCKSIVPDGTGYVPGAADTPLPWAMLGFSVDLFLARLIMCVLMETNSCGMLPCVLFHATHNMIIESIFSQLLSPLKHRPWTYRYFVGESGLFQILVYACMAKGIWRWRSSWLPRDVSQSFVEFSDNGAAATARLNSDAPSEDFATALSPPDAPAADT